MARHQIDSWEFDMWLDELDADIRNDMSREALYDFWESGLSAWEVAAIFG